MSIHHNGKFIEVLTENQSYYADKVIVTASLNALQQISITPTPIQIPNTMTMGVAVRIAIEFESIFWPTDVHFLGYIGNTSNGRLGRGEIAEFLNLGHNDLGGVPILIMEAEEDFARYLCNLSEQELINKMQQMTSTFGQNSNILYCVPFCFHSDIDIMGTFAYANSSGFIPETWEESFTALEHKGIYFGGEHAHINQKQLVSGAYLTGLENARKIDYIFSWYSFIFSIFNRDTIEHDEELYFPPI